MKKLILTTILSFVVLVGTACTHVDPSVYADAKMAAAIKNADAIRACKLNAKKSAANNRTINRKDADEEIRHEEKIWGKTLSTREKQSIDRKYKVDQASFDAAMKDIDLQCEGL